jgi:hypothetical protein
MKVSYNDWLKWAAESGKENSIVSAYIEKYPDSLLRNGDPAARKELETYATPRGWGVVNDIMNYVEKNYKNEIKEDKAGIPLMDSKEFPDTKEVDYHLIASAVGEIEARAFKEYYINTMKLPNPWDIAASPGSATIPPTNAGKIIVIDNLVPYYIESPEAIRDSVLQYVNRMEDEYRATFISNIRSKFGSTVSDIRLVKEIGVRLHIPETISPPTDTIADAIFFRKNPDYVIMDDIYLEKYKYSEKIQDFYEKCGADIDIEKRKKFIKSIMNQVWRN